MAAIAAELLIPLAIGSYSALTGWYECIGHVDPHPIAENMCGGLREALNKSCSITATLPVPYLAGSSLTLGQRSVLETLSESARTAARTTYVACGKFWRGQGDLDAYIREITYSGAIINAAVSLRTTQEAADAAKTLGHALQGQGVEQDKLARETTQKIGEIVTECKASGNCPPGVPGTPGTPATEPTPALPGPVPVTLEDLQKMEARILKLLKDMTGATPPPAAPRPVFLLGEIYFSYGDARVKNTSVCQKIASQVPGQGTVEIIGYTDPVGNPDMNPTLGLRRAESVRMCLKLDPAVTTTSSAPAPAGMDGPTPGLRRASVFFKPR